MPLVDDHDSAEACLDSWDRQAFARDRLQLVVVDHGIGARRAKRLRARLQPQDKWLQIAARQESVLYDGGARAADAPVMLFTEAHCIARPEAAREVFELFRANGIDAAVVSSGHIAPNALAHAQMELEHEWIASWPAAHPRVLSLRGYAIRREAYVELGGFQHAHGRFCETALAIALARSGRAIGSTRTLIEHVNCPSIRILVDSLSGCARGQMVWRDEMDVEAPGVADEWLGVLPVRNDPAARRSLLRAIAASLIADRRRPGAATKALGELAFARTLFPLPRVELARAIARWWLSRFTGRARLSAYRALWLSAFNLGFLEHPISPTWVEITCDERSIVDLPERALAGFHEREPSLRWSGPAALLRLAIPPGDHRVRFTLRSLLPVAEQCITVFVNGRRIDDVITTDDALEVALPDARQQELVITCRASRAERDDRLLGLGFINVSLCR